MEMLKICWLFPDTLYLHGERGNILALERFVRLSGFEAKTEKVGFDTENFNPDDYDIIFCPPGEIASFPLVLSWLEPYKEKLIAFINEGKPLIATGTSVALWTKNIKRADGTSFDGMGILNVDTIENAEVYGDDVYFSCTYGGKDIECIGNQIQMANFDNHGEKPFGQLKYGYGNTGKNREEGFLVKNSIFTNTLGPMLVLTPELTIEIVKAAAEAKGLTAEVINMDMDVERKSFQTKKEFISKKESRLTNCER